MKITSYRLEISTPIFFKVKSISLLKTTFLYFPGHTKWYNKLIHDAFYEDIAHISKLRSNRSRASRNQTKKD